MKLGARHALGRGESCTLNKTCTSPMHYAVNTRVGRGGGGS